MHSCLAVRVRILEDVRLAAQRVGVVCQRVACDGLIDNLQDLALLPNDVARCWR